MATSTNYASWGRRLGAILIDGLVLFGIGLVIGIAYVAAGVDSKSFFAQALNVLISWAYYVYFVTTRGQTLGKMALGIKVVDVATGKNPDVLHAILRETVGRIVSGLVLALGYLWPLWDTKKQGWHDKIANTVVLKTK